MNLFDIPSTILDKLNTVMANFFWGYSKDKKQAHWLKWNKITKLKEEVGLGIWELKDNMHATRIKLAWRITQQPSIWTDLL
jgi:hypothetical protein